MAKKIKRRWQRAPVLVPLSGTAYVSVGLTPTQRQRLRQAQLKEMMEKLKGLERHGGKNQLLHAIGAWAHNELNSGSGAPDFSKPIKEWAKEARLAWERLQQVANIATWMESDPATAVDAALALGMDVAEAELDPILAHASRMAGRNGDGTEALARYLATLDISSPRRIADLLYEAAILGVIEWQGWRFDIDAFGPQGEENEVCDPSGTPARELRRWRVVFTWIHPNGMGGRPARPVSLFTLERTVKRISAQI